VLTINQAQKIVLNNATKTKPEKIGLVEAQGFCLTQDIYSPMDIPLFENSAMDGYAVRTKDIKGASSKKPICLNIIEEIPAGYFPKKQIKKGECSLIMTGAVVPKGADAMVMVEYTKLKKQEARRRTQDARLRHEEFVNVYSEVKKGENIRKKGEVIRKGKLLLKKGALIRPQEIALLASVKKKNVRVFQKTKVAVLSTGNEIVPLDQELKPGQLVDSNRYGVIAQLKNCGAEIIDLGIAKDIENEIEEKINEGLKKADIIITIGGVSVGQWDLVKKIIGCMGKIIFWKINMKPGGPTTFGKIGKKLIFGLPGNPVASLIAFDQIFKPALLKMMGRINFPKQTFPAILESDYHGKSGKVRLERVFIKYKNGKALAQPVRSLGSADMRSMTQANGLMIIPQSVSFLRKGEKVLAQVF
jgi:molybdopterin molybdotransferase